MKQGDLNIKRGFTIIEVSLVIAIAGLIFLMAFIALPSLQRSQRDARRRDDVLTFLEEVKKYQTNNRGALPAGPGGAMFLVDMDIAHHMNTSWGKFYSKYLGENFTDPDGTRYKLQITTCATATGEACGAQYSSGSITKMDYRMYVVVQAKCSGDESTGVVKSSNPRSLAVLYRLEGSGVYCANT